MSCQENPSTLPPPCYHCRPPRFSCPKYGCPPPEPSPPKPCCREPCGPLRCRPRSEKSPSAPPPTLCIAGPCPEPVIGKPACFPPPQKIKPPRTSVRFCIQDTCEGSTYCPCYKAEIPGCSSRY